MPTLTTQRAILSNNASLEKLAKDAGSVLYLDARKATGYGLPLNSPLTDPWVDLSGSSNNATPTNMAGTTASGVDTTNANKPFWVLDGSDDFFSLVNTPSIDITTAPLAVFATVKFTGTQAGYILIKNVTDYINTQYGMQYSGGAISPILENGTVAKTSSSTIINQNIWYNVGFIWDGTNVKVYINQVQSGATGSYSGILTSRPFLYIGKRDPANVFLKGNLSTLSIYAGAKATEANVLKAEKAISKAYIGG